MTSGVQNDLVISDLQLEGLLLEDIGLLGDDAGQHPELVDVDVILPVLLGVASLQLHLGILGFIKGVT